MTDTKTEAFNLADLIVRTAYSYAGVICHPDEEETDAETTAIELDDVLAAIPTSLVVEALKQALALAIPAAIRQEFTRDQCDTCDTPYLRCVEKAFDAPPGTLCCGECSHKDTPVGSQRVYSPDELTGLLHMAATGAPTLEEAVEYLGRRGADAPTAGHVLVPMETLRVATNIGLTDARKTLAELRAAVERKPGRADLSELVASWEDAVARLEAFAGPSVPSRKREASDG